MTMKLKLKVVSIMPYQMVLNKNASTPNPYGKGQASKNIIEKLINLPLENLIFKKFLTYRKPMNSYQTQKNYKKLELLYFCLKAE